MKSFAYAALTLAALLVGCGGDPAKEPQSGAVPEAKPVVRTVEASPEVSAFGREFVDRLVAGEVEKVAEMMVDYREHRKEYLEQCSKLAAAIERVGELKGVSEVTTLRFPPLLKIVYKFEFERVSPENSDKKIPCDLIFVMIIGNFNDQLLVIDFSPVN